MLQGILMVKPIDCATKKAFRILWIHESMRVFHDRLIDQTDRTYFTKYLARASEEKLAQAEPRSPKLKSKSSHIPFSVFCHSFSKKLLVLYLVG